MPRARTTSPARRSRAASLAGADLLSLEGLARGQIHQLFATTAGVKKNPARHRAALRGRSVVLLFEKPSLRTRVTFEIGVNNLGGHSVYLDHAQQRLGQRESVRDYGKNLERWADAIVARVYKQSVLDELAAACQIPVVNALSDLFHPCQALADFFTLAERVKSLEKISLAFIGDGNNVCHSLMHAAALLGVPMRVITPKGREPSPEVANKARAMNPTNPLLLSNDPADVRGCDAVYTDAWVSMGQDAPADPHKLFGPYQVNARLMSLAKPGAFFMHCLPAHRGEEVTDEVIDSPASIVYDQAENRLHAQNALLLHIFGKAGNPAPRRKKKS